MPSLIVNIDQPQPGKWTVRVFAIKSGGWKTILSFLSTYLVVVVSSHSSNFGQ
jgi:hypothetical protein